MRLFVALPLAEPARDEVAATLKRLRDAEWPVRWVRDEVLHVTLKFYGEVAPERLEVIEESIRFAAAGAGPLALRLGDVGAFPTVQRGGEEIGFPPEGTPFHPHVTLGRVREGHRLPSGALQAFEHTVTPVPFLADQLVLYESMLTPQGPQYEARLALPLTA
jgi:2'-5' RNA ligase